MAEVRPAHPLKAKSPTVVTLSGSTMEARPLQSENAAFPIRVTQFGNTM
jgi:hypothetical protein